MLEVLREVGQVCERMRGKDRFISAVMNNDWAEINVNLKIRTEDLVWV